MHRLAGVFACIAWLSAGPAMATTESLVTVIVPVENWESEGYCQWEMIGADLLTSENSVFAVIAGVLSRPINTFAHGYFQEQQKPEVNINPIHGDPPIAIRIDGGIDQDLAPMTHQRPRVEIEIGSVPDDPTQRSKTLTRAKLALVFTLKNIFVANRCAKVTATIQGLPEQEDGKVRLYEKTQYPYTSTSPHFLALIKELSLDVRCMAGRPLIEPLPFRNPRHRC